MYAVGRLGSYITSGVSTVLGPFHPFGGAVDIVVVEQQDGSFKSSPWYVRFGKFQGVWKAYDKVVKITVNGVEANFHMYLDHTGGAYFLRDGVDEQVLPILLSSSLGDETLGELSIREPVETKRCNEEADRSNFVAQIDTMNGNVLDKSSSQRSRILGLVFGRNSMTKDRVSRVSSLESAEVAADLLELKWSTNFDPEKYPKDNIANVEEIKDLWINDGESETDKSCLSFGTTSFGQSAFEGNNELKVKSYNMKVLESERISANKSSIVSKTGSEMVNLLIVNGLVKEMESRSLVTSSTFSSSICVDQEHRDAKSILSPISHEEEQFLFSDLDAVNLGEVQNMGLISQDQKEKEEYINSNFESNSSPGRFSEENMLNDVQGLLQKSDIISSQVDIPTKTEVAGQGVGLVGKSLPIMFSQCDEMGTHHLHRFVGHSLDSNFSKWMLLRNDVLGCIKSDEDKEHQLLNSQHTDKDAQISEELEIVPAISKVVDPSIGIDPAIGSGRLWPLKRPKNTEAAHCALNSVSDLSDEISLESTSGMGVENYVPNPTMIKKKIRVLTPTSEQLASLNLKEGKNLATFTFSTAMMGKQQVNARIFLWRWDTRIVISDVDGTITKSDLLGQFMPMVGQDWSQTGVTHFFSAIKENGYKMLFLSARSISQSYYTKQFLINLKQDGKALPDGPVLISPDGLFPSLFREVIRRTPHVFKIVCLEDIRALFPCGRNPFYAGFGNRDSDEVTYLKVGIPKGKIFIINPKGEVFVNHRVDSKSYTSLQDLVNAMFPPMFSSEQEGFNSWNYWKLPPPAIDI